MIRSPDEKDMAYERLGVERFGEALSTYDTRRRAEVLAEDVLPVEVVAGREALDVGCGLGFFSEALNARGARVAATDISPTLVEQTKRRVGCDGRVADALDLRRVFGPDSFEIVVSSECIEHTPGPTRAVVEMARVLRSGGYLALSTPNLLWQPVVRGAPWPGLRPFAGHENFSTFARLRATLEGAGMTLRREVGLHLFPFQLRLHRLSTWCDRRLRRLAPLMINLCVLAEKRLAR